MAAHDVLRQAAALVEAGWSQGDSHAQDSAGNPVPLFGGTAGDTARAGVNPAATRLTMYGAVVKALHTADPSAHINTRAIWDKLSELVQATGYVTGGANHVHPVIGYNNAEQRTQAEVQTLLLLAAEELDPHEAPVPVPDAPPRTDPQFEGPPPVLAGTPGAEDAVAEAMRRRVGPSPFEGMK